MTISPARSPLMTVLATSGFAVNSAAWTLIGAIEPYLQRRYGLGAAIHAAVLAVPLVVGAFACVPVGALTDRYGARLTFPLVSLVSAGSVATLAVVHTAPALVLACCALGVGGAAFAVGAAMLTRSDQPGRRGLRLSALGAGLGGAAVGAGLVRPLVDQVGVRTALLLTAAAPAAYAVVAAALIRDTPYRRAGRSMVRDLTAMLLLRATRYWIALYAVAVGGLLAVILYLPNYLHQQYRLDWPKATLETAAIVTAAALAHPVGGWLAGRHDAVAVLVACLAAAGALGVVVAFRPALPVAATALLGIGSGLGAAGGTVCDLLGRTVPRGQAGLVAGVVGAGGALAGSVPPLVLTLLDRVGDSYEIGMMLLATVALATALHLYLRRDVIGDALAYPLAPGLPASLTATGTTVVAVSAMDAAESPAETATTLADLGAHHELVIVYGLGPAGTSGPYALMDALRARLPRFRLTAVFLDAYPHVRTADCDVLAELLEEGALAVAVVPTADPGPTAEALAARLKADTALRLGYDPADGTRLRTLIEPASPVPGQFRKNGMHEYLPR